eukprot:4665048-Amphidinium_carterae.2
MSTARSQTSAESKYGATQVVTPARAFIEMPRTHRLHALTEQHCALVATQLLLQKLNLEPLLLKFPSFAHIHKHTHRWLHGEADPENKKA